MSAPASNSTVRERLSGILARIRRVRLLAGGLGWLAGAIFVLLFLYWAAGQLAGGLLSWSGITLMLAAGVLLVAGLVVLILRPLRRAISPDYLAAKIERRYPRFRGILLTATQLQGQADVPPQVLVAVERTAVGLWRLEKVNWPVRREPLYFAAGAMLIALLLLVYTGWPRGANRGQAGAILPSVAINSEVGSSRTTTAPSPMLTEQRLSQKLNLFQYLSKNSGQEEKNSTNKAEPGKGSSSSQESTSEQAVGFGPNPDSSPSADPGQAFAQAHSQEIQALDAALHGPTPSAGGEGSDPSSPSMGEGKEGGSEKGSSSGQSDHSSSTPNQENGNNPPAPSNGQANGGGEGGPGGNDQGQGSGGGGPGGGGSAGGERQGVEAVPAPVTTPAGVQVTGEPLGRLPQNVQMLADQLAAGAVDEKLLRKLKWTQSEAQGFVRAYREAAQSRSATPPAEVGSQSPLRIERGTVSSSANATVLRQGGNNPSAGAAVTAERRPAAQPGTLHDRPAEDVSPAYRTQLDAFYQSVAEEAK